MARWKTVEVPKDEVDAGKLCGGCICTKVLRRARGKMWSVVVEADSPYLRGAVEGC